MPYPVPANEQQRLQELRSWEILDTPPERAFDRISSIAARVFNTPIALVSLIDADRQWLKSCFGVDMRQTSRDVAFCSYTIMKDEVMVVSDATRDERFRNNPLVTGDPRIRFYAGAPLKTPRGLNLGSLCVLDTRPRHFSQQERELLSELSEIVIDEMELRKVSRSLLKEVEERRAAEARLEELATTDPLTQLCNRHGFDACMEEALANAHRGIKSALLYLDLDSFKIVNDTLGHGAGDRLLVQISHMLRRATRDDDKLGRFGGDEFVVIVADVDEQGAATVAERIRERMEQFVFSEAGQSFNVGASIGVTLIDGKSGAEELLAQADAACYSAKSKGRNRAEWYRQNQEEIRRLHEETNMLSVVTEALRADRMELWLQPVVELGSGRTTFYESLLRLRLPSGEVLLPNAFLPAASRYRLMTEIDRRVVTEATRLLGKSSKLELFVNLSGASLEEPDLVERFLQIFEQAGVEPQRATFEITETEIIRNLAVAREVIQSLRSKGFRFALDDFGSGLSNLAYLKTLPLDFLKIDESLTRDVHRNSASRGFAKAVNEIARYLSMRTIAEFVEDEEAVAVLRSIGVDYGQGYFFAKPKPAMEVIEEL